MESYSSDSPVAFSLILSKHQKGTLTEAVGISRGMIRAAIAASISVGGLAGVLGNDEGDVVSESRVAVVGDEAGGAAWGVSRHILVEVRDDRGALGRIVAEDVCRPEQTLLLATVQVEFECVGGSKSCLSEDAEGLEDDDGA